MVDSAQSTHDNTPEASAQGDVLKSNPGSDARIQSFVLCFSSCMTIVSAIRFRVATCYMLAASQVFLCRGCSSIRTAVCVRHPFLFRVCYYISNWSCFSCERCHTPTGGPLMRVTVGAMCSSEGDACLRLPLSLFGTHLSTHNCSLP